MRFYDYNTTMRMTTWNVNGLRAVLNKGMGEWFAAHAPDVLMMQEIKARPEQLQDGHLKSLQSTFPHQIWNPAEKLGYSGVASLAKTAPLETRLGLGIQEFDCEGRVIGLRYPDFWLFNIYFPSGSRGHERVGFKLEFYARVLELCDQLHARGEALILCGDFNTAHREIDLRNPKQNAKTSGFLPEERAWVDKYLEHGFADAYRRLYPERAQYTWWTAVTQARARNVGWRLDYYLVSEKLMAGVKDVIVHEEVMGSDHCPVTMEYQV
jgi:exodeoxyribonuclease-3